MSFIVFSGPLSAPREEEHVSDIFKVVGMFDLCYHEIVLIDVKPTF